VHSSAWQDFFIAHPKLEGFLITQSPRFDVDCMESLVTHCPEVKELRLCEVGQMKDAFLYEIAKLRHGLWFLDLSDPTDSCSESAMIDLVSAIGENLTHLFLPKHDLLTDTFLTQGLRQHTRHLESLTLSHLPQLTDEGVAEFFDGWKNSSLLALDMSGNVDLGSAALEVILQHSGRCLEYLNINGWKDVGNDELVLIGQTGAELKKLDVGWCRAVDDFVLKGWLEGETVQGVTRGGCKRLQEVKVWGCNKVSAACSRKVSLSNVSLN
jgi:DNA repair protein RAD7